MSMTMGTAIRRGKECVVLIKFFNNNNLEFILMITSLYAVEFRNYSRIIYTYL